MKKPFPAYKGSEPYIAVCYAHKDASSVYQDLTLLSSVGINVWYDEGIAGGKAWRAEIASAIKSANKLVYFISKTSLASKHCLREVDYALSHDIEIIPVYLEDAVLPEELALVFNRVQALFRRSDRLYSQHLVEAIGSNEKISLPLPADNGWKSRFKIPLLVLASVLLGLGTWNYWSQYSSSTNEKSNTAWSTNAYDSYLQGLALLKRWDKDDNLDSAITLFQEAYLLDPNFALAYARTAEALRIRYILSGEASFLEQASDAANQAVSLNPQLAPVQVALGLIHYTRGNVDLAIAALNRALAIDANDAMANQAAATVYAQLGRIEDAEAAFQKAIALDPENPTVLNGYANFLYEQGRFDDAIMQWQAVIRLAPDHYVAMVNLGTAFDETLRFSEAIAMYQQAIDIRPSYLAYSNLGTAYSKEAEYDKAASNYLKALDIDNTDSLAWGNLAFVYSWMDGMDNKANETFKHAIELAESSRQQNPRDAFIHSDLALYYAKTKQPVLALQRLRTATTLAPYSAEILSAAAEAYEILEQREKAITYISLAIEHGYSKDQLLTSPELAELAVDPRLQN